MKNRTEQDLLAERRSNMQEFRRERDPIARATLAAHVALIDAELQERDEEAAEAAKLDKLERRSVIEDGRADHHGDSMREEGHY